MTSSDVTNVTMTSFVIYILVIYGSWEGGGHHCCSLASSRRLRVFLKWTKLNYRSASDLKMKGQVFKKRCGYNILKSIWIQIENHGPINVS